MNRLLIFCQIAWRTDPQYGFIDAGFAWTPSGILNDFSDELSQWERL